MELSDSLFNDMSFMLDHRFLVGAHTDGIFSVISLEQQTARILENPIGGDFHVGIPQPPLGTPPFGKNLTWVDSIFWLTPIAETPM